jgi:hypothetical protein
MTATDATNKCHCLFYHPATPEEREALSKRLDYCRRIGDMNGVTIILAQLTTECHARKRAAEAQKATPTGGQT